MADNFKTERYAAGTPTIPPVGGGGEDDRPVIE